MTLKQLFEEWEKGGPNSGVAYAKLVSAIADEIGCSNDEAEALLLTPGLNSGNVDIVVAATCRLFLARAAIAKAEIKAGDSFTI